MSTEANSGAEPAAPPSEAPLYAAPAPVVRWLMGAAALGAAIVSGYLLYVSLATSGAPVGCGAGSACETVLKSPWSNVMGVPVSAPAVLVYIVAIIAVVFVCPCRSAAVRQASWGTLLIIAGAVDAAAVWFIWLQLAKLKAICPWCMADHALALMLGLLVAWTAPVNHPRVAALFPPGLVKTNGFNPVAGMSLFALGLLLTGSLVGAQLVIGPATTPLRRLAAGKNDDTGPGDQRRLTVLDGRLALDPFDEPMLGSPNAPKLIVILLDYCCPHCRATHGYLREGLTRYPDQYGVILLPMPLSGKCNPAIRYTEPRFREACEIAQTALAVWIADREKFAEFDRWLFEPELPRSLSSARVKAAQLVTLGKLQAALANPQIKQRIDRNVKAYVDSKVEVIPIIMSPGFDTVVGRPESAEELFKMLEAELGLRKGDGVQAF